MDYGVVRSVLDIIEYFKKIGKEKAVQVIYKPTESELSKYDQEVLADLVFADFTEQLLTAAFSE